MKDSYVLTVEVKRVQNITNWRPKIISEAHYFYLKAGKKKGTDLSAGTRGWNFHWSSSGSKVSLFMILFFSSGGMKFSMMRYLHEHNTHLKLGQKAPNYNLPSSKFSLPLDFIFLLKKRKGCFSLSDVGKGTKTRRPQGRKARWTTGWRRALCDITMDHTVLYSRVASVNPLTSQYRLDKLKYFICSS